MHEGESQLRDICLFPAFVAREVWFFEIIIESHSQMKEVGVKRGKFSSSIETLFARPYGLIQHCMEKNTLQLIGGYAVF